MASDPAMKSSVQNDVIITTTEMHTGGEAVRIIESGFPIPQGNTLLEKIDFLKNNYDAFRRFVILEPHGHYDMYGVVKVPADHPDADFAVIFLHNEGYGPMCGHACISLGRYAVDRGLIKRPLTFPETQVNIQAPCGLIKVFVKMEKTDVIRSGRVRFECVPCFVAAEDVVVHVDGIGKVTVDVVFGGAFYTILTATDAGLEFNKDPISEFSRKATLIKAATAAKVPLSHPEAPAFHYGVMFIDSRSTRANDYSTNICIFADAETDRSPCGSGTAARVALMYKKGLLSLGQDQTFKSGVNGSEFTGRPLRDAGQVAGKDAVIVEVEGQGYYSGIATLTLEKGDTLGRGFIAH